MIADDMTEFIQKAGGCYGFLGMCDPALPETHFPLHHSKYAVSEEALLTGALVEAQIAADFLAG